MPTNRKLLGAAAFSLALAGGGVAGAVLGTPDLSNAQDGTESTAPDGSDAGRGPFGEHRGEGLDAAADAIGISVDDLAAALREGQSIAQVAEANGVEPQTVIDAMVANGTDRLNEAIAELPDRITEMVNREGLPERGGRHGGPGGRHGGMGFDAAADAIGISVDELQAALREGSTLAEVAAAQDVEVQVVIDALVTEATAHLDEAVANGRLTDELAAERQAGLEDRITAMVNGERPERPEGAAAEADSAA
jgi:uncharacterized protein (DUF433 family)